MADTPGAITQLLTEMRNGNKDAESQFLALVYGELHRLAAGLMRRERPEHTLQPTALVNEAYVRLVNRTTDWENRSHFFAVAAQVMRRVLVDYARSHRAGKRGGALPKVDLDDLPLGSENFPEKLLALDEALSRLSEWDPRQSRIVELRFFGGLTEEEIATLMQTSTRTVRREWSLARAWLYSHIGR